MSAINILTAIPSRSRALSTPLPVMPTWRDRVAVAGAEVRVDEARVNAVAAHHNSMTSVSAVGFPTTGGAYGAAKQAAPPRGNPR